MARFALVRGWIECEFESTPAMRARAAAWAARGAEYGLAPDQARLYARGWVFPEAPLNYVSLVFYGADVRSAALGFVRAMVGDVAGVEEDASGLLFVDADDGQEQLVWHVAGSDVSEEARPPQPIG